MPRTPNPPSTRYRNKTRGRPARRKYLKKTTAKGAYGTGAKKNFGNRRRAFVEGKKREHSVIAILNTDESVPGDSSYWLDPMDWANVANDDAYTRFDLASFYRMSQGLRDYQMLGDTVFSRYLKCKVEIRFPQNTNLMSFPNDVFLIQGYVTTPINANDSRAVAGGTGTTAATVTADDVLRHTTNSVKQYFDEDIDRLRFMPKQTTDIKIIKKVKLIPKLNNQSAIPPTAVYDAGNSTIVRTGVIPDQYHTFTWTTNRKIHLEQGDSAYGGPAHNTAQTNTQSTDLQNMYPNTGVWYPFLIIFNPSFAEYKTGTPAGGNNQIEVRYNDCHWYTDS